MTRISVSKPKLHHQSDNLRLERETSSAAPRIMQFSPLANPLASATQLEVSGSQLDGIPPDLEDSVRYAGARLTQAAGALLRLPQEVIAQAIIVFMRFWVGTEGGSLAEFGAGVSTMSPGACSCTSIDSATASIGFLTLPRHKAVCIS